jgi:hypothetical protein
MRRGLMAWDPEEIPRDALQERVRRLQAAMTNAGQDAMIVYTNFIRSAAVSYLTAFSPYWADGILLVPRDGEPVFATTLSKRVGSWIQTVKPVGDLVTSPAPGTVLGKRLAEMAGTRRVAILELDKFPGGLYDELSTALPGIEFVDGTETFAQARSTLDSVERYLLTKADAIAQQALQGLDARSCNLGEAVGAVEKAARLQGAEEVYIAIAADLDSDRRFLRLSGDRALGRRCAIRATVAYKGNWVRATKTYSRDEKDRLAIARADARFKEMLSRIDANRSVADQIAVIGSIMPDRWLVEAVNGTTPLAVILSSGNAGRTPHRGPGLIVSASATVDDVPWCGAGLAAFPGGASGES